MYIAFANDERARRLLPLYPETVGSDHCQERCVRPNGSEFHHIYVVERGEGVFKTPKGEYVLGAGTVLFMRQGYPVSYECCGAELRAGWITFTGKACDDLLEYYHAEDFAFFQSEEVAALVHECVKEVLRGASVQTLARHMYGIVEQFFTRLHTRGAPAALGVAKAYIEHNHQRDIAVSDVAAAAEISSSLLYRQFREWERSTPIAYLRRVRIAHAMRLLVECPALPIFEIGRACGYADFAYFCKVFKDEAGISPKTYRSRYTP